jgi:hypothetical protein
MSEPVALRYDFDGNGYLYMDAGSGSDWASRVKDCEFLYTHPQKESSTNIDWLERCIEQTQLIANLHQEIKQLKADLHNVIVSFAKKICNKCNDTNWVCENHPDQEAHACKHCGGAGMPCEYTKKASEK